MSVLKPGTGSGARTCVVVSYWTGLSPRRLHGLLHQMRMIDAGRPFDLVVVCNGGDQRPLTLPRRFDDLKPRILNRENDNYNLGAWDHGWRNAPGYEYYLFLQDNCFLKEPDWLYAFERRMDFDHGVGLLGEVETDAGASWEYIRAMAERPLPPDAPDSLDPRLHVYLTFQKYGVALGSTAHHIPSIILFARRGVLEEIGGFRRFGPSKNDAIAAEVAFSREIAGQGYSVAKITNASFHFIGHAEWKPGRAYGQALSWTGLLLRSYWKVKDALKPRLGLRRKSRKYAFYRPFPHPDVSPSQFLPPLEARNPTSWFPDAPRPRSSEIRPTPGPSIARRNFGEENDALATGRPLA